MFGSLPAFTVAGLTLGLREGVIALIVLVALYMALMFWRMRRLRGRGDGQTAESPAIEPVVIAPDAARSSLPPADNGAAWGGASERMAADVLYRGLEGDLAQLREEVDAIRGELAGLREDMRQEMAQMRAAQTVSPLYGDAMQMALSGYDSARIADRCGIARAEADLVVALAKSQGAPVQQ